MNAVENLANQIKKQKQPVSLRDYSISSQLKLMVLAPHPDDFDAISVTLKHFQENGNQILLIVLTGASSGVDDTFLKTQAKEQKEQIRQQEQKEALKYFGLPISNVRFLYMPEDESGDLISDEGCRMTLRKHFEEIQPDAMFLPHGEDTNPSHKRTYELAREIASKLSKPILAFYNQDPKTIEIQLDTYMEFDEDVSIWKRKMLRYHQSQQVRNMQTRGIGFDDRILIVNEQIAGEIGIESKYAEGFQVELLNAT